ncbi:MAG: hypothetical protein PVG30_03735 [Gammaproteobacteria bacterium]|jgi:hypothetical protein
MSVSTINNTNTIVSHLWLQDVIDENLTKAKATLDCLLAAEDSKVELDKKTIYNAVWSARDILQEIVKYQESLKNRFGEKN